jgi:hypothetical protein
MNEHVVDGDKLKQFVQDSYLIELGSISKSSELDILSENPSTTKRLMIAEMKYKNHVKKVNLKYKSICEDFKISINMLYDE